MTKYREYTVSYMEDDGRVKKYTVLSCDYEMLVSYLRCSNEISELGPMFYDDGTEYKQIDLEV